MGELYSKGLLRATRKRILKNIPTIIASIGLSALCATIIVPPIISQLIIKPRFKQKYDAFVQTHMESLEGRVKSVKTNSFSQVFIQRDVWGLDGPRMVPMRSRQINYSLIDIETKGSGIHTLVAPYKSFKEGEYVQLKYFRDPNNDGVISFGEIRAFSEGIPKKLPPYEDPKLYTTSIDSYVPAVSEKAEGIVLDQIAL